MKTFPEWFYILFGSVCFFTSVAFTQISRVSNPASIPLGEILNPDGTVGDDASGGNSIVPTG